MPGSVAPFLRRFTGRISASLRTLLIASSLGTVVSGQIATSPTIKRSWLVDDGLPHNVVNRCTQDAAGFLWLATGAGLTRFDGRDFKLKPIVPTPSNAGVNIRDLTQDAAGTLVFLPASGGVMTFHDGHFTPHPASEAVQGKSLVDLYVETNGTIWLGAEDESVIRWQGGQARTFGRADGLNRRGNRFSFAPGEAGRTWIAGGDFFGWYEDGKLHPYPEAVGGSIIIAPARSGGVWISTFEKLSKLENGRLTTVLEGRNWPPARSSVHHLFEDRKGGLWIATRRDGLFYFSSGKVTPVETTNPLISSVSEDREGNIWVSMEGGGLDRLRPKAFLLLDRTAGLTENLSTTVCIDEHGAIWCANRNGGLIRYFNSQPETVIEQPEAGGFLVISACPDQAGYIWVGTTTKLYRVRSLPPYTVEAMTPELPAARGLFCARNGDLWISAGNGELGFFRQGVYRQVLANSNSSDKRITVIDEDPAGSIWAASRDATLHQWIEAESKLRSTELPREQAGRIIAMHFDHAGSLWLGTPQGLVLKRGEKLHVFSPGDGLPSGYVDQILEDDDGRLWLGGRIGLFHVSIADLLARADGQRPPVIGTTIGKDEGLAGATPLNGGEPETWKGKDGRLWFVTHRGAVGVQPKLLPTAREAPPTYIDEIRIDGQPISYSGPVRIAPGNHRLDFDFVALNFSAPEKVHVRHKLVGLDLDWLETASEHTATYARLPPGRYEMQVVACNQDGVWSQQATTVAIIAVAAWWQTPWATLAGLVVFTLLVAWVVRHWSQRRLKLQLEKLERENAIERERARIARDLHDELGGSMTQIRLLAERIKRHSDQPEFKSYAIQLSHRARRLGRELESIIWTVSPKNNTWDRLASFIGQYALKFFRDSSVACTVQGVDRIPALPLRPEEQHNLLAVAKEALNNVVKHAQASRVTIEMTADNETFGLVIADDGIGFDPESTDLTASNGLNNMRARLGEIGGTLVIESAPGRGTRIVVSRSLSGTITAAMNGPSHAKLVP